MTIDIDLRPLADETTLHLPGDPGYDAARVAWNLAVDQRPAAVALPRTAVEVAQVVRAAAAAGLRVAPQSTGHNAGPLAAQGLDDVVLARMSGMDLVVADPTRGIVRAEGGAIWEPAVDGGRGPRQRRRCTAPPPTSASPATRSAAASAGSRASSAWPPTASPRSSSSPPTARWCAPTPRTTPSCSGRCAAAVATSAWSPRSSSGCTRIETAYAGFLLWDIAHAESVLREWAAWAPSAPDEITTAFRVMRMPELPDLPDFLRGREIAIIDGAVLGSDDLGRELLADLRALRPEMDTFDRVAAASLVRLHMDPEGGVPFASDTAMLAEFPEAALDAFLAEVGPGARDARC